MQQAWTGNPSHPGILKEIMDWLEGIHFKASLKEVTHAQEVLPGTDLSEGEKQYGLFTGGSYCVV